METAWVWTSSTLSVGVESTDLVEQAPRIKLLIKEMTINHEEVFILFHFFLFISDKSNNLSDHYLFEIIIDLRISMRPKEQGVINRAAYLPDFFSHVFITCFFKILHDPKNSLDHTAYRQGFSCWLYLFKQGTCAK